MAIKIESGRRARPQKVVIYGPEGVGKSTLAQHLPAPIFIDAERGTDHLDVDRIQCDTIGDVRAAVSHLLANPGHYKTAVIDTVDWVERRLSQDLCKNENAGSIEDVGGGYGKGYTKLAEHMMDLLALFDRLRSKGMHVVLLAHAKLSRVEDPEAVGSYDRFELKMEKKGAALVKEWADALLFLNFRTKVVTEKGKSVGKGQGGEERTIYTTRHAARDAKNRHGLPDRLDVPRSNPAQFLAPIFNGDAPAPAPAQAPAAEESAGEPETEPQGAGVLDAMEIMVAQAGGPDRVLSFLKSRKVIANTPGVTLADIPADYAARVLSKPDAFVKAVDEFHAKEGASA